MPTKYPIKPSQVAALRALQEGVVELSAAEIAVRALLLPNQARTILKDLEDLGLVHSWTPATSQTVDLLFDLTDDGQKVCRALDQFRDVPQIGTIVRIPPPFPSFLEWLGGKKTSYLEIVPDR